MGRRVVPPTFADVVREVRAIPPTPAAPDDVLDPRSGRLIGPDGTLWQRTRESIAPSRAAALAAAGAVVAWESCGCGGLCGHVWFDADDVARLVAAGMPHPKKRRAGALSEWEAAGGRRLVVAEGAVRWGTLIG